MSALNEMMDYTFTSKYARWLKSEYRREEWKEAVSRVKGMMVDTYASKGVDADIDFAYDMMLKKKVLGSQRALQYGGAPMLKTNARGYNCCASYCDRLRFFQETFWLLLCGCGTGFSVQKHHVAKLPEFQARRLPGFFVTDCLVEKTFVIPDTIEGWADALGVLLTYYFGVQPGMEAFAEYANVDFVKFDYSLIRPKGSVLSSGVGKAPGPGGLKTSIEEIRKLLDRCVIKGQTRLRPIDAYDITMFASDAVLSGGVRRSATIAIFSADDIEMLQAKTGNWMIENPQRARSNNSVLLLRDKTSFEQFQALIENTKQWGEPGFVWADDPEANFNPCVEVEFWCYQIVDQDKYSKFMETYDGNGYRKPLKDIGLASGWEFCNLSTINASSIKSVEDFMERGEAAAIIGTLQAGYTKFDYLGPVSEAICKREALLGVSMTGVMEKPEIVLDPENQRKVAEHVKAVNKRVAALIGINPAARTTVCKPEGTTSCLLGTSSGIHPHHAKRYLRRMQANKDEVVYQYFKNVNPNHCEESVWSSAKTDDIITFPIEVPDGSKLKNQIGAIELLGVVKSTQENWVCAGTNLDLCTQPWLRHNVSNTITVMPHEWAEVTEYIYDHRDMFCGISLLPQSGDKDYPQAPFVAVLTTKEIVKEYGDAAIWTSGLISDALGAFEDNLWEACKFAVDNDWKSAFNWKAETPEQFLEFNRLSHQKVEFLHKMIKFANKYMGSDVKKLTYCMKDVYNWKLYCDLASSLATVDYQMMIETEDNTTISQAVACTGGSCERA
jgi:ribonucleoside-diphosphate reductase alpha chain